MWSLRHSPSGRDETVLSKIPILQPPFSEEQGKLQSFHYAGTRAHNFHLRNFFHHNQAFQEKGLKACNCLVPSLITHKRNKNEGSSLLLSFISKGICPTRDQELRLLGMEILSLGKVPLLFPGWLLQILRLEGLVAFL